MFFEDAGNNWEIEKCLWPANLIQRCLPFWTEGLLNKTLKKSTPSTAVPEKNIKKGKQHQSVSISI